MKRDETEHGREKKLETTCDDGEAKKNMRWMQSRYIDMAHSHAKALLKHIHTIHHNHHPASSINVNGKRPGGHTFI